MKGGIYVASVTVKSGNVSVKVPAVQIQARVLMPWSGSSFWREQVSGVGVGAGYANVDALLGAGVVAGAVPLAGQGGGVALAWRGTKAEMEMGRRVRVRVRRRRRVLRGDMLVFGMGASAVGSES